MPDGLGDLRPLFGRELGAFGLGLVVFLDDFGGPGDGLVEQTLQAHGRHRPAS